MPVETDLKDAYQLLYDKREPLKALKKYDDILKQSPENLVATIYKAAALEKLYFGSADWHNDQTLENSKDCLEKALNLANTRGDRSKIALVYFRYFIHYFNSKDYASAQTFLAKCKEYGYQDKTLPMWEYQLQRKLDKLAEKGVKVEKVKIEDTPVEESKEAKPAASEKKNISTASAIPPTPKFRTDWYQTANTVSISIFTVNLPKNKECVTVEVSKENKKDLEVSYPIPDTSSTFQYDIRLSHEVDPENVQLNVLTKKMEITLTKLNKINWKNLEYTKESESVSSFPQPVVGDKSSPGGSLGYPTSSKKSIDWSKVDLSDEEDENSGSADAFFKKLYANADPDTKRAMMKSYMESNGTALNTNWEDVSKAPVETSPPEGMELKHW